MYVLITKQNNITHEVEKQIIKTGKLNIAESEILILKFLYKKLDIPLNDEQPKRISSNEKDDMTFITIGHFTWILEYIDTFTDYSRYSTKLNKIKEGQKPEVQEYVENMKAKLIKTCGKMRYSLPTY